MKGIFITGTDTGIGKTWVAQVIIHALRDQYNKVAAMKPVASGALFVNGLLQNEDAVLLQQAANVNLPYAVVNPYCFSPPIAPHIAAELEGISIDLQHIRSCFENCAQQADVVVVEGVGGWLVPLNDHASVQELAKKLNIPIVLVVGLRLGCLNHALLTAQAIHHSGLNLMGWIGTVLDPDFQYLDKNIQTLKQKISAPCLGVIPFQTNFQPMGLIQYLHIN